MGRNYQLADSFGCTHDVRRVHCFVGGNQHKRLAAQLFRQAEQAQHCDYIVFDSLLNIALHHRYMLVGSRMEDDLGSEFR